MTGSTGSLEASDQAAAAVQKTPNRVTLDSLKAKIVAKEFHHPAFAPEVTVCMVKTANGFVLVGMSAPADPANFDPALGEKFALEDCIRQMWPLEGYLLREQLHTV
jgi:hypothetical protein